VIFSVDNTRRFAMGLPANNVLLWGARGMGKSSLVKSVHAELVQRRQTACAAQAHRNSPRRHQFPAGFDGASTRPPRFILFCDDLSFDHDDTAYKSLKAALDGGIEGRPENALLYATSNRRHLLPRDMMDNERSTAINPSEAVEEKVSLSDRFGLWLGFHKCSQDDYLDMVNGYAAHYQLDIEPEALRAQSLEWATTRGSRSGRVAWQFIQDLARQTRPESLTPRISPDWPITRELQRQKTVRQIRKRPALQGAGLFPFCLEGQLFQIAHRIDRRGILAHFEMQPRGLCDAGHA
jgi:predicted AAA+ superfamily ATPase